MANKSETSKADRVVRTLHKLLLSALPDGTVADVNSTIPEVISEQGLVIVRDGDPGEPELALGGFRSAYYSHSIPIEIYAQHGLAARRDEIYQSLLSAIDQVLEDNQTLEDEVFGLTYGAPGPNSDPIAGAEDLKSSILEIFAEYETTSPLA